MWSGQIDHTSAKTIQKHSQDLVRPLATLSLCPQSRTTIFSAMICLLSWSQEGVHAVFHSLTTIVKACVGLVSALIVSFHSRWPWTPYQVLVKCRKALFKSHLVCGNSCWHLVWVAFELAFCKWTILYGNFFAYCPFLPTSAYVSATSHHFQLNTYRLSFGAVPTLIRVWWS